MLSAKPSATASSKKPEIGGLAVCAQCELNACGAFDLGAGKIEITWAFELPADSTAHREFGKPRIRLCEHCFDDQRRFDVAFARRHRDTKVKAPAWLAEPATPHQHDYLNALICDRQVPGSVILQIDRDRNTATKGIMSTWITQVRRYPKRPETTPVPGINIGAAGPDTLH